MLVRGSDGVIRETRMVRILYSRASESSSPVVLPSRLSIPGKNEDPLSLTISFIHYPGATAVIYRGRNGMFGWVGEVEDTGATGGILTFKDYGIEPDYRRPPITNKNPFEVWATGDSPRVERPAVSGYHDQRHYYAGTIERPEWIIASAVNDFLNFDKVPLGRADASIQFLLASSQREEIRSLVSLDRLLVFTDSSVWTVEGPEGRPLSATDLIQARIQLKTGSSWIDPLVIGRKCLFVRDKNHGVHDFYYSWDLRNYTGSDISSNAEHLMRSPIVAWAFAPEPWHLVWAVRDDGTLLSLNYDPGAAWSQHETDGLFQDVACIPEGNEDVVYVAVRRFLRGSLRTCIERMAPRVVSDVRRAMCLDSGVTHTFNYSWGAKPTSVTVTGLGHLEGRKVAVVCEGQVMDEQEVSGGAITTNVPPDHSKSPVLGTLTGYVHVGLPFVADLELLDVPQSRERKKIIKKVTWDIVESTGLKVGEKFSSLFDWRQRRIEQGFSGNQLETGQASVFIKGTWNTGGRAVLRQTDPLPVTVLGVTREGEYGD